MKQLTLIDKAFFLKRTSLFQLLDLDLLLAIADKLGLVLFDSSENIFNLDEEANRMYFIVKGEIEIQSPHENKNFILKAGEFFGEESLFSNKLRSYIARSLVETHLMTLSRTSLFTIISECPSVALSFLQAYASQVDFRPYKESQT